MRTSGFQSECDVRVRALPEDQLVVDHQVYHLSAMTVHQVDATYTSAILRPHLYHRPPTPTRCDNFTAGAEALSADRTLVEYGGGSGKVVNSLETIVSPAPFIGLC